MKSKLFQACFVFLGLLLVFLIFSASSVSAKENLYYIHQDHLGSTALVTDEEGIIVSRQTYYPYGATRSLQSPDSNFQITERQYTGQVSDQDQTGLYYYNARYYNPLIAKFTQADAVEGPNRYAYVGNNPIINTDPLGLMSCSDLPGLAGKICHWIEGKSLISGGFTIDVPIEDATKADLVKSYIVLRTAEFIGEAMGYDESARHMAHFLSGEGTPLDYSEELQDYLETNKLDENFFLQDDIMESECGHVLKTKFRYRNGAYEGVVSDDFPFLTESDSYIDERDQSTSLNKFTLRIASDRVKPGYSKGYLGVWVTDPEVSIFDHYDWHENSGLMVADFELPLIGIISVNDNLGSLVAQSNWGKEFDIHGFANIKGEYFIPRNYYFYQLYSPPADKFTPN